MAAKLRKAHNEGVQSAAKTYVFPHQERMNMSFNISHNLQDSSMRHTASPCPPETSACSFVSDFLQRYIHVGQGEFWARQGAFQRSNAYMLAYAMLGMLVLTIGVNLLEGNRNLSMGLTSHVVFVIGILVWLQKSDSATTGPAIVLVISLMGLGAWLLLSNQSEALVGSMVWFMLFPTMTLFSLGLRLGSLFLGAYALFLGVVLFSPLSVYLVMPLDHNMKVRMMLGMLGGYIFSGWAEFIRENTRQALVRSMKRLEEESRTDALTGLGNRRDFDVALQWMLDEFQRDMQPYALAFIDLDRFKRVNDTFGHAVGDNVLLHVSQIVSRHIRTSDRLFRWGGEEFILLMPRAERDAAYVAAERVRKAVSFTPYLHEDTSIPCTISIGLYCGTPTHGKEEALTIADQNLYQAKCLGRNRVVSQCPPKDNDCL